MSKKHTAKDTEVLAFRVPKAFAKQLKQEALDTDQRYSHLLEEIFVPAFYNYLKKKKKPVTV